MTKKRIILFGVGLVLLCTLLGILLMYFRFFEQDSRQRVIAASQKYVPDPAKLATNQAIQAVVNDGVECGIIRLDSGENIPFWFCNPHAGNDIGTTLFRFPDGDIFFHGYFCCEVDFPKSFQHSNSQELRRFIAQYDGTKP